MAEIKQSILGPVNGKVGTVLGVMWRGINYIHAKPHKSSKNPTMKQLLQWDKMSLVSTFASKFREFVNANCPSVLKGKKWIAGKEQMISRLMTQGIGLSNGEQHIKVEEALLSIGNLAPAVIKKINRLKTGKFKVQWENGLINALTLNTDQLTMMLYNETLDQFIAISNVGNRIDKYAHFSIPTNWDESTVYFWSMWKAADGSVNSRSCFHGIIELENGDQNAENGKLKAGNGDQETEKTKPHNTHQVEMQYMVSNTEQENENQEVTEVIPIEQARVIALKKYLEEVNTPIEGETTPPLNQNNKERETTPPFRHPFKEGELKRWTPPGYIRKVNKDIIKQSKNTKSKVHTDQSNEGVIEEEQSILKVLNIMEEKRE
ncbi:DUF6266 family protein [Myroides sp. M-43]|uniref:DUF6266 family protein n=1 Tax=Myroides oncorhynchi TaxID=2893756 RepID=UPI001E56CEDF|nr:DUF6266 family protein [Myroides oncorhynchi]MCC9041696.1 DUF6266 family protein [Myroides oncorhynchi]